MKKVDYLLLSAILIIGLIFRLYKINTPLADLHSWRQVDTAAVGRRFATESFDLFHPKYDDLSSLQTSAENPKGYRFVEFPIYNAIFALAFKALPVLPIEVYGRLISVIFSLLTIAVVYYLTLKESGRITAFFSSLIYAVFPFFVFFSRTVLPETTALGFCFISIFFLYKHFHGTKKFINYLLSIIFFSASILIKPTVVFYGLAFFYLFFRKYSLSFLKKIDFYLFFIIAVVPFFLWRYYISAYPEGIPANLWLITSVNTFEGQKNIFFKPAFFRWIFFERINNQIFGGFLIFFFLLGAIIKTKKYFLHSLLISAFLYLLVFQGGNVQHEYYQILVFPALAIFTGLGINHIIQNKKNYINSFFLSLITIMIVFLSFFFSFYKVKDFYDYSKELVQIANIVKNLTKPEDKIITDRMGDTTFLYLMDRKGSPAPYKELPLFKADGYKYYVTLNEGSIKKTKEEGIYQVKFENDKFALFEL